MAHAPKPSETKQISLNLPADLDAALAARAQKIGENKSALIRQAIREFLAAPHLGGPKS